MYLYTHETSPFLNLNLILGHLCMRRLFRNPVIYLLLVPTLKLVLCTICTDISVFTDTHRFDNLISVSWDLPNVDAEVFTTYSSDSRLCTASGHSDAIWMLDTHAVNDVLVSGGADGGFR